MKHAARCLRQLVNTRFAACQHVACGFAEQPCRSQLCVATDRTTLLRRSARSQVSRDE